MVTPMMYEYMTVTFPVIYFSHGLIPNGGRVYYLRRSQPPMLTPMMYEYLAVTGDMYIMRAPLIFQSWSDS